jgi:putative ABC transport system ATP-binding protein
MIPDSNNMIEIKNLTRLFRTGGQEVRAVDDMNFKIQEGEFIVIMGPSGSGKTTLLNLLGGLDRPTEGKILVDGENIARFDAETMSLYRRQTIGFIFQSFNLLSLHNALENVCLPMIWRGDKGAIRKERAKKLLASVGLAERLYFKPNQLSGGEKQRVSIARALANNPKIILADEPTGNLDSKTGLEIIKLLKEINQELGVTIIVITHDADIARVADRIIRLKDGRIVK